MEHTGKLAVITILLLTTSALAQAQGLVEESLRIPMREAGRKGLEAVMVRPDDNLAHPLALLTHGTPREADKRDEITALTFIPQAREFARRGWTTVVVVRRGYGTSGGSYAEEGHACSSHPTYARSQAMEHCGEAAPRGDRCTLVALPPGQVPASPTPAESSSVKPY